MLCRYIGNVASNPGEEKFRRIRVSNAAFQSKVASAPHGLEFLEIVGFKVSSVHGRTTSCRLTRALQRHSCTHVPLVGQTYGACATCCMRNKQPRVARRVTHCCPACCLPVARKLIESLTSVCVRQVDASGEFLEITDPQPAILNAAGGEISSALSNPFFGAL